MKKNGDLDILTAATELLKGPPLAIDHRGWGTWWCPFHDDAGRRGDSGKPNFGVDLETGRWNCFRCNQKGGSLYSLAKQLGSNWTPPENWKAVATKKARPTKVDALNEALIANRQCFVGSPAMTYARDVRGLTHYTAAVYSLGYGLPAPQVSKYSWDAARESRLIIRDTWLWAGSVVYADPPMNPAVINCRYIPDDLLPAKERWFGIDDNHHTWGRRKVPLGAWRITPQTKALIVVEGMFDMLVGGQTIAERGLHPEVVCVYTNGAAPSAAMLQWFTGHAADFYFVLIPDNDKGGLGGVSEVTGKFEPGWQQHLEEAIKNGGGQHWVCMTPDGNDPDQAFLSGWWPSVI